MHACVTASNFPCHFCLIMQLDVYNTPPRLLRTSADVAAAGGNTSCCHLTALRSEYIVEGGSLTTLDILGLSYIMISVLSNQLTARQEVICILRTYVRPCFTHRQLLERGRPPFLQRYPSKDYWLYFRRRCHPSSRLQSSCR